MRSRNSCVRTRVGSDTKNGRPRGGADLVNLYVDLHAFGGDALDPNIVVGRVVPFCIPKRVLSREYPPDNQRNDTADEERPGNDTPGDVVPWLIFGLPHERTDRVSDTVGNQEDGVGRDPFSMTCGDGGDPGKGEGKPGHADADCPDRAQKSNLITPWQDSDEDTS